MASGHRGNRGKSSAGDAVAWWVSTHGWRSSPLLGVSRACVFDASPEGISREVVHLVENQGFQHGLHPATRVSGEEGFIATEDTWARGMCRQEGFVGRKDSCKRTMYERRGCVSSEDACASVRVKGTCQSEPRCYEARHGDVARHAHGILARDPWQGGHQIASGVERVRTYPSNDAF